MVIESIPKAVGMAYAIIATIMVVVLMNRGKFSKRKGYVLLVISTLFGFLIFAPMLPYQFQSIILGKTQQLGIPIALAVVVLFAFVGLAFAFGRAFCGYVCPIGTIQELVYHLPVKKLRISVKAIPIVFRLAFFAAFIGMAVGASVGLLKYTGVKDLFYLSASSAWFFVFLALVIASVFIYRPFCRFLCPYGVFLSLASILSRFGLVRTDACVDCGKCEKTCPTREAGRTDLKQECYLCYRCKDICPENAIMYGRRRAVVE
jgi:polyferredoxin